MKFDYRYGRQAKGGVIVATDSKLEAKGSVGPLEIEDAIAAALNGDARKDLPKMSTAAQGALTVKAAEAGISATELVQRACAQWVGAA